MLIVCIYKIAISDHLHILVSCVFFTRCGQAAILDGNYTKTLSVHLPILVSFHVRFCEDPSNPLRVMSTQHCNIWNCIIYCYGYTWLHAVTNVFAMKKDIT
jgi:hypothetical protein